MADEHRNTQWHRLFGFMLQELLTPVGLTVQTELPVSTNPPKIDIVIIRREGKHWTPEQLNLLPDGVRDSQAPYILLEFKYTESFEEDAIYQIGGYEKFYRDAQKLSKRQVQSFLVISKTPREANLAKFDYEPTIYKGVYKSKNVLATKFSMLVLNRLSNEPYNIYFKLFASKLAAKREAVAVLEKEAPKHLLSRALTWFLDGLLNHWFVIKGDDTMLELTPEQMIEAGKLFKRFTLPRMPLNERLADISLDKIPESELKKIPFIHDIEKKGRTEGLEKGRTEGRTAGLEKGRTEGRTEGLEKGRHEAKIESLNQIILFRFNAQVGQFDSQLAKLDLKTLNKLTEVALTVENLADFEQALLKTQTEKQINGTEKKI